MDSFFVYFLQLLFSLLNNPLFTPCIIQVLKNPVSPLTLYLLHSSKNPVSLGCHRVQLVGGLLIEPLVRGSNLSGARVRYSGLGVAEPLVRGSNPLMPKCSSAVGVGAPHVQTGYTLA